MARNDPYIPFIVLTVKLFKLKNKIKKKEKEKRCVLVQLMSTKLYFIFCHSYTKNKATTVSSTLN